MCKENSTTVTKIHLLGFQGVYKYRFVLFSIFLMIHILTLTGNALIIISVSASHQLHSPMYFFLCHLSVCDMLFTIDIVPNMLYVIWEEGSEISLPACLIQFHVFGESTSTECLLLTVMSYDRYLAICKPLHYSSIMDLRLQYKLVIWTWVLGFIMTFYIIMQMFQLQFCGSQIIDHYFCDFAPLLDLSCSDASFVKIQVNLFSSLLVVPPFIFIIVTYFYIFLAILKISSTRGRQKAFYTCSSHLAVVCTYYGSLIAIYMASSRGNTFSSNKMVSLFNTVCTPLFNPITYSLRNVEIRQAIWRLFNINKNRRTTPIPKMSQSNTAV